MREIDRRLRQDGALSLADYGVLITLVTAPGLRLRMSSLGAQRMLTPSGITRVVIRLEERGLVRREPDPADGRAAFAVLTKPGLEALRRAQVIHHATVRELYLGRLTQHELDRLAAALREGATGRRQRFRLAAAADERLKSAWKSSSSDARDEPQQSNVACASVRECPPTYQSSDGAGYSRVTGTLPA